MDHNSNEKARNGQFIRKGSKLLIGITAMAMVTTPIALTNSHNVASAATTSIPSNMASLAKFIQPIFLSKVSYINMVDAAITPSNSGQTVAFTLSIYNGSSSTLDLSDYWFRLTDASGGTYTLKTASADASINQLAPKTKQFITLYAEVGEAATLSDLILKVVKFDFSASGYEVGMGRFSFPSNFNNVVSNGAFKALYFNNTTLYTKVSSASVGTSGDDTFATVNFVYNNIGKKSITLTGYKYYIVTATGETYEATPTDAADVTLNALEREEIQLTATIPSSLKTTGWKLVVVKPNGSESTSQLPVGGYAIQFGTTNTSTSSTTFNYTTSEGVYNFELSRASRQPWENEDVLSARIRITNKSTSSVSIPDLAGYFYLDDKVKLNFTTVATSNPFGLNAGAYVDVDVYAKLPTSYSFSKATLVINDQVSSTTTTKAGELTVTSAQTSLPVYAVDKTYQITRDGSKSTVSINSVNIYNNTTSKVLEVKVDLQNNESRSATQSNLVAYFINDNGDTFPATLKAGTGLINPSSKSLLSFTAVLPQEYFTGNMRLVLGEGVTNDAYSVSTASPTAYLNAVKFNLPNESTLKTVMKDIPFLNYKLTINEITPNVMTPTLNLDIDYTLVKDMTYNAVPSDYKLIFNIEGFDPSTGKTYTYSSQDLDIGGNEDTSLVPGTDKEVTLSKDLNYDTIYGSYIYYARIYAVTQDSKKLLAEHTMNWYIDNNWSAENAAAE
ncbi:hypothetical protein [Cohnella fermenti]|uniref:Uncharacterized protein n=1 Tax=Cohnella fermenti TaxID=2565925 RepID=A0A4S4C1A6_9BACL|nr:hypothetical protein [Cohnella fermenti]THF80859.1 hypothetical protein E6C55_10290 [Cohnella fermenti]